MSPLSKTKPVRKKKSLLISKKEYLCTNFPLEEGEFKVDYKEVAPNCFRINFWKQEEREEALSSFKANFISRSYYVVLKKDGNKWGYVIK